MCNQITDRCKLSGYASGGCPEIPAALLLAGGRRQPLPERRDLEHDVDGDCLEARILGHRLGELRMDRCRGLAGAWASSGGVGRVGVTSLLLPVVEGTSL